MEVRVRGRVRGRVRVGVRVRIDSGGMAACGGAVRSALPTYQPTT